MTLNQLLNGCCLGISLCNPLGLSLKPATPRWISGLDYQINSTGITYLVSGKVEMDPVYSQVPFQQFSVDPPFRPA